MRSSRSERRAVKQRNRRILVLILILLILAVVLFIALGGLKQLGLAMTPDVLLNIGTYLVG
jgi:TRAP-type C4-dicarboxylate transport system permease small subunit